MQKVLITDGLLRKSLSATRSLGRKGIYTIVGEHSWFSPSGFSKYCHKRLTYPEPKENKEKFLNWLIGQLKQENDPVFMPMDDAVMDIVMEHLGEINKYCKCLLPPNSSYVIASDKYETMKLAKGQRVRCPVTYLPKNQEELKEIAEQTEYPLVIKPRRSSGSRGIRKVENRDSLLKVFSEIELEFEEPMVQEYIPLGDRYDVCLLYDKNHEVKASFVQKEIRHFPIQMGPSTVQESVLFEELVEQSIQLLEPLHWCGVVEVEYMMDPRTNQPVLMEINPRYWNSLELAVQCGVDFPYLQFQLCSNEEIKSVTEYEVGRMNRWMFPGDLLHFLLNKRRFSMTPSLFSGKNQSVYDDTFSLSDSLPGIVLILSCFRFAFSIKTWKMFFQR